MYNRWRAEAAFWAAWLLEQVATKETENLPWGMNPSESAKMAIRVYDLALRDDPEDTGYAIRCHRAFSIALAGRSKEARDAVKPWCWQLANDPGFSGLYVRLLALSEEYNDETLSWLDRAIDQRRSPRSWGWSISASAVRSDPSLAKLREKQATGVAELLRPKYDWRWVDGFLSDEVYLTNKSNFWLRNVKLAVTFKGGTAPIQRTFETSQIGPGATIYWKDLNIPARQSKQDSAQLRYDESPAATTQK